MAKSRRRFGPLFYATSAVALVLLVSCPFWQAGTSQLAAWRLTRQLRGASPSDRREAAAGLMRLGPAATSWVIGAMRDGDPLVREQACSVVVYTVPERPDEALAALLVAAKDSTPAVRATAVAQLETLLSRYGSRADPGTRERALRGLCESLDDESAQVRRTVVVSLFTLGPKARGVVGELDRILNGTDRALRVFAAEAMLRIDPDATSPRVSAAMSSLLLDQSVRMEYDRLVRVLIRAQGEEATAAMLIPILKHPDRETRSLALFYLTERCPGAKALRPAMIEVLANPDGGMREEAALYFLKTEPGMAAKAIEALAQQIVNPQEGGFLAWDLVMKVKRASAGSVKLLAAKLLELLPRASERASREFVIVALGEIGPDAAPAVPSLLELSNASDPGVALRVVESLVKIDPRAAVTRLPALVEWMGTGHDSRIRLRAMAALRDLGPAAASAMPALLQVVDEENLAISTGAIEAITKIDPITGSTIKQGIERGEIASGDRAADVVRDESRPR